MKQLGLVTGFIFLSLMINAQQSLSVTSLDDLFAGVPLQKSYDQWISFVSQHPYLGIDSTGEKGVYSSIKPGMKSHFPFPDSIPVKMLLYKKQGTDSLLYRDSARFVLVEGIFGNNEKGSKEAGRFFRNTRSWVKKYYNRNDTYSTGVSKVTVLTEGKTASFPDLLIETAYYKEEKFYYVLFLCEFSPKRNSNFRMDRRLP